MLMIMSVKKDLVINLVFSSVRPIKILIINTRYQCIKRLMQISEDCLLSAWINQVSGSIEVKFVSGEKLYFCFFFFFFFSMSFCSMSEYPVSTFVRSVINPSINSFGMTFSIHRRFEFPCRHIYVPDGIPFFYYLSGFRAFTHYMSILSAMRVLCSSLASLPFFFLFLELLFLPWMSYWLGILGIKLHNLLTIALLTACPAWDCLSLGNLLGSKTLLLQRVLHSLTPVKQTSLYKSLSHIYLSIWSC